MDNFESHLKALNSSDNLALNSVRESAYESFKVQGFPTRKNEEWKYTNVKTVVSSSFEISDPKSTDLNWDIKKYLFKDDINIVFIDGIISLSQSQMDSLPDGLSIKLISDRIQDQSNSKKSNSKLDSDDSDLISLINKGLLIEDNGFTALNRAMIQEGISIQVEKNQKASKNIHLIFAHSDKNLNSASFPRVLVHLNVNSELNISETHIGTEGSYLNNSVFDAFLDDGSHLQHYKTQIDSEESFHISHTNINQNKNSSYESFCFDSGSKLTRNSINAILNGEGADAILNGVYLTHNKQHIDNHIAVDHRAPHCTSSQFYKGLLKDESRAVFNGKIYVRRDAQKTVAFQTNKNLLLSDKAEIDTKPQLEIDADDVKCSHGAAIGQLNEGEIFYLMTRGIPKQEAKQMLCQAFVEEAIMKVKSDFVRERLKLQLLEALERGES